MVANIDLSMNTLALSGYIKPSIHVNSGLEYCNIVSFTEDRDIRVIDQNNHIKRTWLIPRTMAPISRIVLSRTMKLFAVMKHQDHGLNIYKWDFNDKVENAISVPINTEDVSLLLAFDELICVISKSTGSISLFSQDLELLSAIDLRCEIIDFHASATSLVVLWKRDAYTNVSVYRQDINKLKIVHRMENIFPDSDPVIASVRLSSDDSVLLALTVFNSNDIVLKKLDLFDKNHVSDNLNIHGDNSMVCSRAGFISDTHFYIGNDAGFNLIDVKYGSIMSNCEIEGLSQVFYLDHFSQLIMTTSKNQVFALQFRLPGLSLSESIKNGNINLQNSPMKETNFVSDSNKIKINRNVKVDLKGYKCFASSKKSSKVDELLRELWKMQSSEISSIIDIFLKDKEFDGLYQLIAKFNPPEEVIFGILDSLLALPKEELLDDPTTRLFRKLFQCFYDSDKLSNYVAKLSNDSVLLLMRMTESWANESLLDDRNFIVKLISCVLDAKLTSILMSHELQESIFMLTKLVEMEIDTCSTMESISCLLSVMSSKSSKFMEKTGLGFNQYAVENLR